MKTEIKVGKAFTLIELIVAIGILAILLSFMGVVFNVSCKTYRTANANREIMIKLRAITDWLDTDFEGIVSDYPNRIVTKTITDTKADRIVFPATGNFQSIRLYNDNIVSGNAAIIFYGQANNPFVGDPREKILTRIQTILTSNYSLPDSNLRDEYCKLSLSEWRTTANMDIWAAIPKLDPRIEKDLAMYMAKGVDNFTIEQFDRIIDGKIVWQRKSSNIKTKALKFTFTLYDSKGIIKQGRTFTHIVYLAR